MWGNNWESTKASFSDTDSDSFVKASGPERKKTGLPGWLAESLAYSDFDWPTRRRIYRRLAVNVRNEQAVEVVLEREAKKLERNGNYAADILRDVARKMRNGDSFADALRKHLPVEEVSVIAAADTSGALPESLESYIATRGRVRRVLRAYRNAITQPIIYTLVIYSVLFSIARYAAPKFAAAGTAHVNFAVKTLFFISGIANSWIGFVPPVAFLVVGIIIRRSFSRWTGRTRIYAERYPPYSYYKEMEGFMWTSGFISVLETGKPDVDVLKGQIKYASPWLKERLEHYLAGMINGDSLGMALMKPLRKGWPSFDFPNADIIDDIDSYGEYEDFPRVLKDVLKTWAEEMEDETIDKAAKFAARLEIFMYTVIGFLIYAMTSAASLPVMRHH